MINDLYLFDQLDMDIDDDFSIERVKERLHEKEKELDSSQVFNIQGSIKDLEYLQKMKSLEEEEEKKGYCSCTSLSVVLCVCVCVCVCVLYAMCILLWG